MTIEYDMIEQIIVLGLPDLFPCNLIKGRRSITANDNGRITKLQLFTQLIIVKGGIGANEIHIRGFISVAFLYVDDSNSPQILVVKEGDSEAVRSIGGNVVCGRF